MSNIRIDRLEQLADHLKNGKLGHEVFDFSKYNFGKCNETWECGYAGCALGECPIIWPEDWIFVGNISATGLERLYGTVLLKTEKNASDSARIWFAISEWQFLHLFVPEAQVNGWGKKLTNAATKEEVSQNISTFCDHVKTGKVQ